MNDIIETCPNCGGTGDDVSLRTDDADCDSRCTTIHHQQDEVDLCMWDCEKCDGPAFLDGLT